MKNHNHSDWSHRFENRTFKILEACLFYKINYTYVIETFFTFSLCNISLDLFLTQFETSLPARSTLYRWTDNIWSSLVYHITPTLQGGKVWSQEGRQIRVAFDVTFFGERRMWKKKRKCMMERKKHTHTERAWRKSDVTKIYILSKSLLPSRDIDQILSQKCNCILWFKRRGLRVKDHGL